MAKVKITLKKSLVGSQLTQRRTVRALGLKRINHTVEKTYSPEIEGMINKVRHLVQVEGTK